MVIIYAIHVEIEVPDVENKTVNFISDPFCVVGYRVIGAQRAKTLEALPVEKGMRSPGIYKQAGCMVIDNSPQNNLIALVFDGQNVQWKVSVHKVY